MPEPESQNGRAACLVKVLCGRRKAALAAAIDADADADASGLAKEAEETRSQSSEQDRQEKSCMQQRRRLFSFFLSNAGSTCLLKS